MSDPEPIRMNRREAIKWVVAASATVSALNYSSLGAPAAIPGIGTDPNLLEPVVPWPRTLTPEQLRTVTALCDMIIPQDDKSPGASAVGVAIALDRQEKTAEAGIDGNSSAVQFVREKLKLNVVAIADLSDLLQYLSSGRDACLAEHLPRVAAYRDRYGV